MTDTKSNQIKCPPLIRITLGQHKSDNYNGIMGLLVFDYNKRLILLSVIQLSVGFVLTLLNVLRVF